MIFLKFISLTFLRTMSKAWNSHKFNFSDSGQITVALLPLAVLNLASLTTISHSHSPTCWSSDKTHCTFTATKTSRLDFLFGELGSGGGMLKFYWTSLRGRCKTLLLFTSFLFYRIFSQMVPFVKDTYIHVMYGTFK